MSRQRLGTPSPYWGPLIYLLAPTLPLQSVLHTSPQHHLIWELHSVILPKYLMPPLCPEYHPPHRYYRIELLLLHSPDRIFLLLHYLLRQNQLSPLNLMVVFALPGHELLRTAAVS